MISELEGEIDRIAYADEENGFTVARVKVFGQKYLLYSKNRPE